MVLVFPLNVKFPSPPVGTKILANKGEFTDRVKPTVLEPEHSS